MADYQADSQARYQAGAQDRLYEEYTIDTPENVSFGYEVAGIGSRFIAALIDSLILGTLLTALNIALFVILSRLGADLEPIPADNSDWAAGLVIAIFALLDFAIWWGYYLFSEWLWHGTTVGKRVVNIRVVRLDGTPVSFLPIAVRNLVRIVDFLPMGYGVGIVTMFCNRQTRRLGDFAAGTLVVKDQGQVTLNALLAPPAPTRTSVSSLTPPAPTNELAPEQDWSGIRRLTPADYELVQETLARYRAGSLNTALLTRVAGAIATKLNHASSSQLGQATAADHAAFLSNVAAAYGRWVR